MANQDKRLFMNFPGEFFVDFTCINCDACRQLAPEIFAEAEDYAYVKAQPSTEEEKRKALRALLSCPTGSIGTEHSNNASDVISDFPLQLENGVFYSGFNSRKSYGGNSYFVKTDSGNWLIDSPRFLRHLVQQFEEAGGIDFIFLSHRDDVGDADKFAKHFGSQRIIHRADLNAQPNAEIVISGESSQQISDNFMIIPTPGHTKGHCCLLYKNKYLFTGDHLWWDRYKRQLHASQSVCWYSWPKQVESVKKLRDFKFRWILPAHGQRVQLEYLKMHNALAGLIETLT